MTEPKGIRELNKGDKVKCKTTKDGVTEEEILTYDGMDGMYAKLLDKEGTILNAVGYVRSEKDYFIFCSMPE